jgi:two-component system, cell cycle sensor histidine kinase and response regulator CckA
MRDFFRNAPIQQKVLAVILATTALALLLAGIGIVAMDSLIFRRDMQRDLLSMAQMVGYNSAAALVFGDPHAAAETLDALRARPHTVVACLYGPDGMELARYARGGSMLECPAAPAGADSERTEAGAITVWHPIVLEGRRVGTLYLLYDLGEVPERILLYGGVVLAILLLATGVSLSASSGLRALIAVPVIRLAAASHHVSESGDYGIRVHKEWGGELGLLVDAFNQMLARIQRRDAEVQRARTSLETTLTSIGDAVVSTDAAGRVRFANPVAVRLLRCPLAEMAGQPIDEVFHIFNELTRKPVESPVQRVLREGTISGLANHTILIARDGTEVPIDDSAAPIRQDGETVGVVLVFRDITEKRRAQADAGYLAAIVESSEDAIIGKSPAGVIQSWNAGAERVYGYTAEETIGRTMVELLPDDRKHEESNILERLRTGAEVMHFETVRLRKGGKPIDVLLTISPIRDRAGQVVGISHVARDVTELKRAAEQIRHSQKLESLGVLAGGIAHDFNNLLTGILGNASLAIEDVPEDSRTRTALEGVITASERAAQLAQQMLAYSGKGRFVVERMDLSRRVRETLPLIRAAIPPRVEVKLNLAEGLPELEADPGQIQQVVMNIIINGAEAIPEDRTGTVTVETREERVGAKDRGGLETGRYVVFQVTDTGCGMDEETKTRIFDPFFTTKFTGRGLGLAAVLGIVRGHRGAIDVQSAPGKGATFRVLLPAAAATTAEAEASETEQAVARDGGVVLVVDDEQMVRTVARQTLERHGFTVLTAEDGARGLDIYRSEAHRLRCVILDLTMPVMSGEEALGRMKAVWSGVPIILSSGYNEKQALERFAGKGLAGFLQKPYQASGLLDKIRGVLAAEQGNRAGGA